MPCVAAVEEPGCVKSTRGSKRRRVLNHEGSANAQPDANGTHTALLAEEAAKCSSEAACEGSTVGPSNQGAATSSSAPASASAGGQEGSGGTGRGGSKRQLKIRIKARCSDTSTAVKPSAGRNLSECSAPSGAGNSKQPWDASICQQGSAGDTLASTLRQSQHDDSRQQTGAADTHARSGSKGCAEGAFVARDGEDDRPQRAPAGGAAGSVGGGSKCSSPPSPDSAASMAAGAGVQGTAAGAGECSEKCSSASLMRPEACVSHCRAASTSSGGNGPCDSDHVKACTSNEAVSPAASLVVEKAAAQVDTPAAAAGAEVFAAAAGKGVPEYRNPLKRVVQPRSKHADAGASTKRSRSNSSEHLQPGTSGSTHPSQGLRPLPAARVAPLRAAQCHPKPPKPPHAPPHHDTSGAQHLQHRLQSAAGSPAPGMHVPLAAQPSHTAPPQPFPPPRAPHVHAGHAIAATVPPRIPCMRYPAAAPGHVAVLRAPSVQQVPPLCTAAGAPAFAAPMHAATSTTAQPCGLPSHLIHTPSPVTPAEPTAAAHGVAGCQHGAVSAQPRHCDAQATQLDPIPDLSVLCDIMRAASDSPAGSTGFASEPRGGSAARPPPTDTRCGGEERHTMHCLGKENRGARGCDIASTHHGHVGPPVVARAEAPVRDFAVETGGERERSEGLQHGKGGDPTRGGNGKGMKVARRHQQACRPEKASFKAQQCDWAGLHAGKWPQGHNDARPGKACKGASGGGGCSGSRQSPEQGSRQGLAAGSRGEPRHRDGARVWKSHPLQKSAAGSAAHAVLPDDGDLFGA